MAILIVILIVTVILQGLEDNSVFKSSCFFCRWPGFDYWHPHGVIVTGIQNLLTFIDTSYSHGAYTYTCVKHSCTLK